MSFSFEKTPHNSLNCKLVTSILSANQEKRSLKVAKAACQSANVLLPNNLYEIRGILSSSSYNVLPRAVPSNRFNLRLTCSWSPQGWSFTTTAYSFSSFLSKIGLQFHGFGRSCSCVFHSSRIGGSVIRLQLRGHPRLQTSWAAILERRIRNSKSHRCVHVNKSLMVNERKRESEWQLHSRSCRLRVIGSPCL